MKTGDDSKKHTQECCFLDATYLLGVDKMVIPLLKILVLNVVTA